MERSAEVMAVGKSYLEAIAKGDVAFLERTFSRQDGVLALGTDPNEWWPGHDRIVGIFREQFEAIGGGFPLQPNEPQAYSEGNMGWFADRPRLAMSDGAEIPFRITVVMQKEAGEWKIVHSHGSIGVANEEALGEELPI